MTTSYLTDLNVEQLAAATYNGSKQNVLLLAGAGTGKTRTLVARTEYLLKKGVKPNKLALLTFTRRATQEMQERLSEIIPTDKHHRMPSVNTFHMFCMKLLRTHCKALKFNPKLIIIDREDQLSLFLWARGMVTRPDDMPSKYDLANYYSYSRNTGQNKEAYLKANLSSHSKDRIPAILHIFNLYTKRKADRGYLDFDDILYLVAQRLIKSERIRKYVASLYDYILVDEMQDTNHLQFTIIERLASVGVSMFCVGDDAQSLFSFRGADFHNVNSFVDRLPNTTKLKLDINYRSTQEILDMSNDLLNESRIKYDKHLVAHRGCGNSPHFWVFHDPIVEAKWITQDIISRRNKGAKWGDHMVLVRTALLGKTVEGFLINLNIPYKVIGGTGLLDSSHVKDFLSMVRVSRSYMSDIHWVRYLNLWPRIGQVTASRAVNVIDKCSSSSESLSTIDAMLGRRTITDGIRDIIKNRKNPYTALKLARKHIDPILASKYGCEWEWRKRDLDLIVKLSKKFKTLTQFIESYTIDPTNSKDVDANDELVTIITVHSAKGTEAKTCYVLGVQPGVYPHYKAIGSGNADEIEEERRILYVAMTRAEDTLILTRTSRDNQRGPEFMYSEAMDEKLLSKIPSTLEKEFRIL